MFSVNAYFKICKELEGSSLDWLVGRLT